MTPTHSAAAVPPTAPTRLQRFLESGLGHGLTALVCIGLPFVAANIVTKLFMVDPALRDVRNLLKAAVLVGAYWAFVRWRERRPVKELGLSGALPESLVGLLLGGLLFSAVMAVLAGLGVYSVDAVGSPAELGAVVGDMLPKIAAGAVIEEVLFRLVALRLLARSLGAAWAVAISSVGFGLAHLGNVGATPLISLSLGVEAGLLLSAAYLLTRRIWLCTALHLAWNFTQGAVFSIAVSGQPASGWLHGRLTGPEWLTGGAFGAEGSVVALAVCLLAGCGLLVLAARRKTAHGST